MLELDGVNAHYGQAHILHGVSFTAARGEVVALLGRNGAGKSTTMKTIMRIVPATGGRIRYGDRDITLVPSHEICRLGLGYVPEERRIFTGLTVRENLEVGRQPPRGGLQPWTVEALYELFPNLQERRDCRGNEMSGGEQQMLTIARTLMGNPDFVLLDEPSEGLAPVIVEQMASAILRLKAEGLTIIISEQNLHFARIVADRAVILEKGTIRFNGSLAELTANSDIRDAYLSV